MGANVKPAITVPALTFGSGTQPLRVMLTKRGRVHVSGSISCSADQLLVVAEAIKEWAQTAKTTTESQTAGRRSRKSPAPSASSSAPDGSNGSPASPNAHGAVPPTAEGFVFGST